MRAPVDLVSLSIETLQGPPCLRRRGKMGRSWSMVMLVSDRARSEHHQLSIYHLPR